MNFSLHPTLETDTHPLFVNADCHLLLHKNATLPWLILVPHTRETELHALEISEAEKVLGRCRKVSAWIQAFFDCPKVNFASIGNLVPQMHLHMVGRKPGDACWPKPVWGHLTETSTYTETLLAQIRGEVAPILDSIS
ncbi:MAG: HIT domain-containing protein [Verrucomicrobiota bacterium]